MLNEDDSQFAEHRFEQFLAAEWPQDFDILQRARAGDPACTRSYRDWQEQYENLDAQVQTLEQILGKSVPSVGPSVGPSGKEKEALRPPQLWDMQAVGRVLNHSSLPSPRSTTSVNTSVSASASASASATSAANISSSAGANRSSSVSGVVEKLHAWLHSEIGSEHGASPGDFADRLQHKKERELRAALAASLEPIK